MTRVPYTTVREIDANTLADIAAPLYGVEADDFVRALYGDGFGQNSLVTGSTERTAQTRPVNAAAPRIGDVLCDFCERGMLDAGAYDVRLTW